MKKQQQEQLILKPEAQIHIIFGATGDLMQRKLISAYYRMMKEHMMPKNFALIGFSRRPLTDKEYKKLLHDALQQYSRNMKIDERVWQRLSSRIYYHPGNFNEAAGFRTLRRFLAKLEKRHHTKGNKVFYFATLSKNFNKIIKQLLANKVITRKGNEKDYFERLIFEKPFGHDLHSARLINQKVEAAFDEHDIFRIDHYLAKETVQNLMVLRFANALFEPLWNHKYIDNVQIIADEVLGVGSRGGYYDNAGALEDMFQNHLMQLLMFTAMEPPADLKPTSIANEKIKVLQSIKDMSTQQARLNSVKAQYTKGFANGKMRKGYTEVNGVDPDSITETFIAARLEISNWRWAGVPFYLRSGKRLAKKTTKIIVYFKEAPRILFYEKQVGIHPNVLEIRLQPDEGISLHFNIKKPGKEMHVVDANMDFCHECLFSPNTAEAYQVLIHDAMVGDKTLFTTWREIEGSWRITDQISHAWRKVKRLPKYRAGTHGPKLAEELMERDGRHWYI
ncbi:MAG: glucose-6-phosphate dehydrogenase [DPANN group archaeon]|nr:glucose-6-phosphate dehydrogenase [DPANN group archaeon]